MRNKWIAIVAGFGIMGASASSVSGQRMLLPARRSMRDPVSDAMGPR